jgi:DNA sulfur modification protein DndC
LEIRDQDGRRSNRRRNGQVTHLRTGELVRGPFTIETRREILDRLLALQEQVGEELISRAELQRIRVIWAEDIVQWVDRRRAA